MTYDVLHLMYVSNKSKAHFKRTVKVFWR